MSEAVVVDRMAVSGSVAAGPGSTRVGEIGVEAGPGSATVAGLGVDVGRMAEPGSAAVAEVSVEGKSEKVVVEGYTCAFGRTWHASGASVEELLDEMGKLFVFRACYPMRTFDAILVEIWRRIGSKPNVKEAVVKKSMVVERDNFEARMAAFERTEVMRSSEIRVMREEYVLGAKVDEEDGYTCKRGLKWSTVGKSAETLLNHMGLLLV